MVYTLSHKNKTITNKMTYQHNTNSKTFKVIPIIIYKLPTITTDQVQPIKPYKQCLHHL
jgi:hypothetical protein